MLCQMIWWQLSNTFDSEATKLEVSSDISNALMYQNKIWIVDLGPNSKEAWHKFCPRILKFGSLTRGISGVIVTKWVWCTQSGANNKHNALFILNKTCTHNTETKENKPRARDSN